MSAAGALYAAGRSGLRDGARLAEATIDGGAATALLERLVECSRRRAMILDEIVAEKRSEHARAIRVRSTSCGREVATLPPTRPFADAIRTPGTLRVIAEFKRRSPSAGAIRPRANPADVARRYERAGAAAVSVLTDARFFDGSSADLRAVHVAAHVPVLRKDFLLDERDLLQARLFGADAVLLIVRILDAATLRALVAVARAGRPGRARRGARRRRDRSGAGRGRRDHRRQPSRSRHARRSICRSRRARARWRRRPSSWARAASRRAPTSPQMRAHGVDAILVGESLLRAPDPGAALAELVA